MEVVETAVGDCNKDGSVDVADIVAIANHILGKTPATFIESAADVNGDSSIDVADIVALANMLLHPQDEGSVKMKARRTAVAAASEADALTAPRSAHPTIPARWWWEMAEAWRR